MIIHTADDESVRFEEPSAEAIARDRSCQLIAFQEIRRMMAETARVPQVAGGRPAMAERGRLAA